MKARALIPIAALALAGCNPMVCDVNGYPITPPGASQDRREREAVAHLMLDAARIHHREGTGQYTAEQLAKAEGCP